jgi:hypothetical protein
LIAERKSTKPFTFGLNFIFFRRVDFISDIFVHSYGGIYRLHFARQPNPSRRPGQAKRLDGRASDNQR